VIPRQNSGTVPYDNVDLALVEVNEFSTELERYFAAEVRRLRGIVAGVVPIATDAEEEIDRLELEICGLEQENEDLKDKIVRLEDDLFEMRRAVES